MKEFKREKACWYTEAQELEELRKNNDASQFLTNPS